MSYSLYFLHKRNEPPSNAIAALLYSIPKVII